MQGNKRPTERPDIGKFLSFNHIVFWVGNAKITASYYTSRMGFKYLAYRGLETQERTIASHVISNGKAIFEFQSAYEPNDSAGIGEHIKVHGDGVRDVAFSVDDATGIWKKAVERGAVSIKEPTTLKDENGSVIIATIRTYGDTVHTFVQNIDYTGPFLPGYREHHLTEPFNELLDPINIDFIDHVVGNQAVEQMEPTADWYEKILSFHRFWSVDDSIMHTEYSALNSIVVADFDENIKMPINEPAPGKRKSQIQEYVDYYAGSGVQHIALSTSNIIETITQLRKRGVDFLVVPSTYYDNLRANIPTMTVPIEEDLELIEKLNILVDYDDKGYLLQLFTKPLEDRPTLFFEFIQRHNNEGFGAGNFKSLFKAIEDEQALRGNLVNYAETEIFDKITC